ncbi:MAG: ATP-binding protein [Ginsengibacter sp.]
MKNSKIIFFIVCLSIFQTTSAQDVPGSFNMDSLQQVLKNIPGLPQGLPFIDTGYFPARTYTEVFKKVQDALKKGLEKGDKKSVVQSYFDLANLYIKSNNPSEARQNLQNSVQVSKQINDKDLLAKAYGSLSMLDDRQGDYKGAYESFRLYTLYKDSLESIANSQKLLQAQLKHDYELKAANAKAGQERKDAAAKRTRNIQYMIIASLGILILAALVIVFIQRKNNKEKHNANLSLQLQKEKAEGALSELKSTQAQLIQSEKMASLGELTAGIAHEIQNPLNFVNNFSEVNKELLLELQEEIDNGAIDVAKHIAADVIANQEKINHHGKRADAIVRGMLQHSRAGTGQKELVDFNALADEYLRLSYHGLRAKDNSFCADFKTDFDEKIGQIEIVPQDISRVLLNIYNNAFYAANEKRQTAGSSYKPLVVVSTKKINSAGGRQQMILTVKDNGNGIAPGTIEKIFHPFFTTKPSGQGTGLGLSISYDIVKAHGGGIKADSTEGESTTFSIQLPFTGNQSHISPVNSINK